MRNLGLLMLSLAIAAPPLAADEPHRSPIALALSTDGGRLLTANQTAGTVSLIDAEGRKVLDEIAVGEKPAGVAFAPDGRRAVVANWYGYDLVVLEVQDDALAVVGRVEVGPEPRGVVVGPDGKTAYVALGAADEVARVDLDELKVTARLAVGREPRSLALAPDGGTLAVGNSRSGAVSVVDVAGFRVVKEVPVDGGNLRQITISADGRHAYLANMHARGFATTRNNIDLGWVVGQRLTRIDLKEPEPYATISLDPRGRAAGDAHGAAVGRDGAYMVVALGGTHELMIFKTEPALPWRVGGSRDLMPPVLVNDRTGRFRRLELGGRPTALAFAPDSRTLYVANYLGDSVQVVDVASARLVATIPLGAPEAVSLERRGEILFHDATRSFNQWYSCNTCHSDGHMNGLAWDTLNDGRQAAGNNLIGESRKKAPTLRRVARTGPWTWHGWQKSLEDAVAVSFTTSMQGPRPTAGEARAVVTYMATLDHPRNPNREPDGARSPAAERGRALFKSAKAGCASCHAGPELTDGKIHEVGLEEPDDVYRGYNPPSLRGVYDKYPYLHDGRAATLREALSGDHAPAMVGGEELDAEELADLTAYLKSL